MKCTVEMNSGGILYVASVMEIGKDFEGILRLYLSNLKGWNIGITDGRDL
jgi:hypothetical protein